jgi:hypothetical protein
MNSHPRLADAQHCALSAGASRLPGSVRRGLQPHHAARATARLSAARASSRVESSVGSAALASLTISGSSVQPSTTPSQP